MPSNRYYPQLLYVCRVYAEFRDDIIPRAILRLYEERKIEYDNVKMEIVISLATNLHSTEYDRLNISLFPRKVGSNYLYVAHIYQIRR